MASAEDLEKLQKAFRQFEELLTESHAGMPEGPARTHVQSLLSQLASTRGKVLEALPKHNEHVESSVQAVRQALEKARTDLEAATQAAQAKLEQAAARKAARANPSEPPIDPDLGQKLRSQMLDSFGNRTARPSSSEAGQRLTREIWEDWEGIEEPRRQKPVITEPKAAFAVEEKHECRGFDQVGAMCRVTEASPRPPDIRTPAGIVEATLRFAQVTAQDVVCDLGCGDARLLVTAARLFGARGLGVEIDPRLVEEAQTLVEREQVADRIVIQAGDVLDATLAEATVVHLFLGKKYNLRLRETLRATLKPGARVISHGFDMGDWRPQKSVFLTDQHGKRHRLYLWRIEPEGHKRSFMDDWNDWDNWEQ